MPCNLSGTALLPSELHLHQALHTHQFQYARSININMSNETDDSSALCVLPARIAGAHLTAVKRTTTFNYYGQFGPSIAQQAAEFLADVTDGSKAELTATLQAFLDTAHLDCAGEQSSKSCCWFTIRVTKPTSFFDVPRWHQDGRMFQCDEGRKTAVRSKYALTLMGPPTLLLPTEPKVFQIIAEGEKKFLSWCGDSLKKCTDEEREEAFGAMRLWLADEFESVKRVSVGNGEIARFSWGRRDSPVHSEPSMTTDRVFMTVLFGSEAELRNMCEFRGVDFGEFGVK